MHKRGFKILYSLCEYVLTGKDGNIIVTKEGELFKAKVKRGTLEPGCYKTACELIAIIGAMGITRSSVKAQVDQITPVDRSDLVLPIPSAQNIQDGVARCITWAHNKELIPTQTYEFMNMIPGLMTSRSSGMPAVGVEITTPENFGRRYGLYNNVMTIKTKSKSFQFAAKAYDLTNTHHFYNVELYNKLYNTKYEAMMPIFTNTPDNAYGIGTRMVPGGKKMRAVYMVPTDIMIAL